MATQYWNNDEDILNDMAEISDFCKFPQPAPEPSEYMKKLRGKKSIFEDDEIEDDLPRESKIFSGRGHPLLRPDAIKPGGIFEAQSEWQTSAQIREVSGFGYGNELIEHAFRPNYSCDGSGDPGRMTKLAFNSLRKSKKSKMSYDESDISSSSTEYMACSSGSSSSRGTGTPDINNKEEFPALK